MLVDDALITSVLELEDDEVCIDELSLEQYDFILDNLSNRPLNCSETTFVDFIDEASPCCCVED